MDIQAGGQPDPHQQEIPADLLGARRHLWLQIELLRQQQQPQHRLAAIQIVWRIVSSVRLALT